MFSAETITIITATAQRVDLEPAVLMAVIDVESGGRTHAVIQGRKEPLIRFEGHYFDRRLSPTEREVARAEGLAAPSVGAVRNPPGQAARWRMLDRAAGIDRRAAYESTSWGVGQVMGAHWSWLGYPSVDALVAEARDGLEGQLRLMLRYMEKADLLNALRRHDWAAFARGYNGPGYARNSYHLRLALAYRRHSRHDPAKGTSGERTARILQRGDRGEAVRRLQRLLCAAGHPVSVDGDFGPETGAAVLAFQRGHGLSADGIVGPRTQQAIDGALPLTRVWHVLWSSLAAPLQRFARRFI